MCSDYEKCPPLSAHMLLTLTRKHYCVLMLGMDHNFFSVFRRSFRFTEDFSSALFVVVDDGLDRLV